MRKRILPIEFLDVPKPHKFAVCARKGMLIIMDDKNLMEDILLLEKGVCDLYMHGTLESPTSNVHQAFSTALNDSLCMQDTLYDKMAAKGWYPTEQADQNKVNSVKQKFSAQ